MNKILNRKIQVMVLLMLVCCCVQAQKRSANKGRSKDTLADLRAFIQLSNVYQHMPLFLDLEWKNSTNFITTPADTATIKAVFYLKPGLAYIRLDEAEQLVNDSMALLVSDKLQRMILYANARPVLERMKKMTGLTGSDSSLQQMAMKYVSQPSVTNGQHATLKLRGREMIQGSSLPKESLELQYDLRTKEPLQVTTTRRSLVRLSEDDYKSLSGNEAFNGLLLAPEGKGYYLVKEQKAAFIYKTIKHEAGMEMPATIADRLTKNETGELAPVKKYEQYAVTYN